MMQAAAVFQFYLPYVLPRAPDWGSETVGFAFPDSIVARVRPRGVDEELFPNDIDKTLSTMTLQLARLSLPTSVVALKVRDHCHDRMAVQVEGAIASAKDAKRTEIQDSFMNVAITACNTFLAHCRVAARSSWVSGIERHYRLEDGRFYVRAPYSVTWLKRDDQSFLPAYAGDTNACCSSGAVPSPESGSISMAQILQSLTVSQDPSLGHSLLIDAEERVRTQRLREAIIALGTSCEVACSEYRQRRGRANDQQVKKILKQGISFAEKHLHEVPTLLSGRSLRSDDMPTFELIQNMYRTRNNVVHEGRLGYEETATWVTVDQPMAASFLSATNRALDWLATL